MSIAVGSATVQIEMDGGVAGSFDETSFGGSFPGATGESPLISSSLDMNQTMLATMLPDLDTSLVAELVRSGSLVDRGVVDWEQPRVSGAPFENTAAPARAAAAVRDIYPSRALSEPSRP
jgi:hypothetical protein